jgi:hypothetical protein
MITLKDFVYSSVNGLVKDFKNIKASVHCIPMTGTYCIQIQPSDFFSGSKELQLRRLAIRDEFYRHNFDTSYMFIDEHSLLEIKSFEYVITGEDYKEHQELNGLMLDDQHKYHYAFGCKS